MIDLLLGIIILALLGYIAYLEYQFKKERKDLIRAIMAKDLTEMTIAESVDKQAKRKLPLPPAVVESTELSDEEFDKHIKEVNQAK